MNRHRLALLWALSLLACHRVAPRRDDPRWPIQVLSVTPTYRSDGRADFTVLISVDNVQPEAGRTKSARWRIWLRNLWFAEGEQRVEQPLSPAAITRFELLVPLALRKPAGPADLATAELSIRGELTVVIGGAEQALPFAKTVFVQAPANRTGPDED